ncbi:MAG: PA2779 family protein [Chromatiales bacterium]|nr:PA2779 family protein [Chromatiales bacterium]
MQTSIFQHVVTRLMAVAIISMGFVQVSAAGVIGTQQMVNSEARQDQLARMESLLARQDVAGQLALYGVAPEMVMERVQNLTSAELMELEGKINQQVAGGDIVGLVGAVFIVLIILELVGVIDIFKAR